jgi:hypothetical protein
VTVSASVPDFPSEVAVIVTAPGATPVTVPTTSTVAMFVALDWYVTLRPETTFPLASVSVTEVGRVLPTSSVVALAEI